MRPNVRSGVKTGETDATEACIALKDRHQSWTRVLTSLQTISHKCQQFAKEFDITFNDDNQLSEYQDLLTRLTTRLQSQDASSDHNNDSNVFVDQIVSVQDIGNETEVCEQIDGHSGDVAIDDIRYDIYSDISSVETNQSLNELEAKIIVFYKRVNSCGKSLKHFRCPVDGCGLESHSKANISAHLVRHTNSKDFQCQWPNCDKNFGYKKSLMAHIESFHLRKERFKCCCDGCGKVFAHKYELQIHIRQLHDNEVNHRCVWTECHIESKTLACLWPKCGQNFLNKKLLDNHMEENHLKGRIGFKTKGEKRENSQNIDTNCEQSLCDNENNSEVISGDNDLKGRQKSSYVALNRRNRYKPSDESPEQYINKYTGKPLSRRRREKNYVCSWPACGMAFENVSAVNNHMRKHTGEKPFVCDWESCGKTFRYGSGLKLHKEMIHLKLRQYRCDWPTCTEAFISMSQLKVHESEHTGIKKYQCSWPGCEWRTNHTQQLDIHRMRAHEGKKVVFKRYKSKNNSNPNSDYDFKGELKKFPCDWPGCERRFRYANNLDTHLKAHQKSDLHKSEKVVKQSNERKSRKQSISKPKVSKKFRCDWPGCPSIYSTRSMLLQHTNKHTGAKPFACLHCEKRFSYKTTLHSHIQFNHKFAENSTEKAFKCLYDDCKQSFNTKRGLLAHDRKMHQKGNDNDFNDSYNIEEICDNTDNYSQIQPMSQTSGSHYPSIQSNVIRLDRIRAFNSTRIQIPNEHNYQSLPQMIGHNNPTTSRVFQSVVENPVKPQKEVRNVVKLTNIAGNETITKELPIPCTHETCWRRFKTPKALEWHLKKFHPQT